jgi:Cytochrome c554 and c-prime
MTRPPHYTWAGLLLIIMSLSLNGATQSPAKEQYPFRNMAPGVRYVGSKSCSVCHVKIFDNFRRTGMGKSMVRGNDPIVDAFPAFAQIYDRDIGQYFEVFKKDGYLYQSQYILDKDSKEQFRQAWKLDYVVGAGENGYGFMIHRDGRLFEAPLSFYSSTHTWGFSPGYEFRNYGFTRPILPQCVGCHSGKARPIAATPGMYGTPAFDELAVGCENCHGPGEAHVQSWMTGKAPVFSKESGDKNIVNPARLSGWLADNICMKCHQGADVRVNRPGKVEQDFRPGMEFGSITSVFKIPVASTSAAGSKVLEHYYEMTLSKCYRASAGGLHCISCHDPHVQPAGAEAAKFFKSRCLTCHADQNCKAASEKRAATTPPDNCISCHMPKRPVTSITHASLTDHSVPAKPAIGPPAEEPREAGTSAALLHLTAPFGEQEHLDKVPKDMLLQAYGSLVQNGHEEFRPKLDQLLDELLKTTPASLEVSRALARRAALRNTKLELQRGIVAMTRVVLSPSARVDDYILLAQLYTVERESRKALRVLEKARAQYPYFREIYESLAMQYMALEDYGNALSILQKGIELFPEDAKLRALDKKARSATLEGSGF